MVNNNLNLEGLDEIFADTDRVDREIEEKEVDFRTNIDYDNELEALKGNIYNANQLLEKIQFEMNRGNFSARLAEVVSAIINSITQASKEIIADKNYEDYMEVRRSLVELKAKEVEVKKAKLVRPGNQTNVLVATREDILNMLEDKKIKKIENNPQPENENS